MKKVNAPKAHRLPSGSWNCVVMVHGQRRSFTGDSRASVEEAALRWKMDKTPTAAGTLGEAITRYIAARETSLSPSTIRRYHKFQELNFQELQRRSLASLTREDFQEAINAMARSYAPKTVKNAWGMLSSVLKENGREIAVSLPQLTAEEHPFLEPDQLGPFLDAVKGEKLEIPILLGLLGLRRSEIAALTWNDIDLKKAALSVRSAVVQDSDGQWVQKKETKNTSSRRTVPIMIPRLLELLQAAPKNTAHVVECNPNSIYNACNRICDRLGYPRIGCHGLRHSAVSLWYHLGISELAAMRLGGYADFGTMRRIYTHLASQDMSAATAAIGSFFANESTTKAP